MKTNIIVILLVIIAISMILIGIIETILPPILTGVGFIIIAWGFAHEHNK